MKDNGEIINLIDLGKTVKTAIGEKNFTNHKRVLKPSWIENQDYLNEKLIDLNLEQSDVLFSCSEQSAIFSEINLEEKMNEDGDKSKRNSIVDENHQNDLQNELQNQSNFQPLETDLNYPINRNRKTLIKNKLKNLSINNPVLNSSRNNYEKLTDSLLVRPDNSKYYGSFSIAKQSKTLETAFNGVISSINDDHLSIGTSVNSQNLINVYLKEFEQEKHLNLFGFKTILIVILTFCFLINLIYTFKVYYDLTDDKLEKFTVDLKKTPAETAKYWRVTWIVNSIITLIILSIGIIGLLKEKVILILITSVCMMLSLMESDDPINGSKIFNISLLVILITSVLMIIFAARLR